MMDVAAAPAAAPLPTGLVPLLMLSASRRKGDYVPGSVLRFRGHPVSVAAIYLLVLVGILPHGPFI